jgi:hypothetical protein
MKLSLNILAPALCCVMFAACAHTGTTPPLSMQSISSEPSSKTSPDVSFDNSPETIYVNSGTGVSVFDVTGKLLRTIPVANAIGIQADSLGHVFISAGEDAEHGNFLYAYGNRGERLGQEVTHVNGGGTPVVTAADNVWVNCGISEVCEYDSQQGEIISPHYDASIDTKSLYAVDIAVDRSGDLAVTAGGKETDVYAPGSTKPFWKLAAGSPYTSAIAFDKAGDLYVANGSPQEDARNQISVYAKGAQTPKAVLTTPFSEYITAMQFDAAGNLYALAPWEYVASEGLVAVYKPKQTMSSYTIEFSTNLIKNTNMAVDQSGRVYVTGCSNTSTCELDMFKPGATSSYQAVTQGIGWVPYVAASQ